MLCTSRDDGRRVGAANERQKGPFVLLGPKVMNHSAVKLFFTPSSYFEKRKFYSVLNNKKQKVTERRDEVIKDQKRAAPSCCWLYNDIVKEFCDLCDFYDRL